MRRWWLLVAAVVVAFGLGVLTTVMLRDGEQGRSVDRVASGEPSRSRAAEPTPTPAPIPEPKQASERSSVPAASKAGIWTPTSSYFARPFETIQIAGRYPGVDGPRELRLQLRQPDGWSQLPLPVVTRPSGEFRAYVELAYGHHRLRIVDPNSGKTSQVLTALVF